jgi:acid stress-induced BolA-like protein IbaG/YrbA
MTAALASGALGIVGAISQYQAGQTQAQAAELQGEGQAFQATAAGEAAAYQAQVARNNAIIAGYNATEAEQAGATQAFVTGEQAAATGGRIKAAQAASGIDVNTGSAVAVQKGAREAGYLNQETVQSNAELQAYGYRTQQTAFTETAGLETMEANEAPIAAGLAEAGAGYAAAGAEEGAVGSLLANAGGIGFKVGSGSGGFTGAVQSAGSNIASGYNSLTSVFS